MVGATGPLKSDSNLQRVVSDRSYRKMAGYILPRALFGERMAGCC